MNKILTKTQLQKKYDDAKREIIRLHGEITALQKKASDSITGIEQLRHSMDALLTQIVLTRGADTGSGHELYISSMEKDTLQNWKLTAARTETAGILKLRVEPRT